MTLFAARLLVLVAVPVAAWSQAFPKGSSATWQGWTDKFLTKLGWLKPQTH